MNVEGSTALVSSVVGDITVTGTGGSGASEATAGVIMFAGGQIVSTGAAKVTLTGTAGTGGGFNDGVLLYDIGSQVRATGATAISITGTGGVNGFGFAMRGGGSGPATNGVLTSGGSASITINADSVYFDAGTINAGSNSVNLYPKTAGTQLNLGSADAAGTLGLNGTELGNITAGQLWVGNTRSGGITVSAGVAVPNVNALILVTAGSVVDANATGTDITVLNLGIVAGTGGATAVNPLETAVSRGFTASTTTAGVFATNTGAFTLGVTTAPGDIAINASGTMTVAGQVRSSAGNVTLSTTGAGSNVALGGGGIQNALSGTFSVNASGATIQAGNGDSVRASAVVLNAATGIGTADTPLDISAGSVTASNTTSGDVAIRLNSNGGFSITTASATNSAALGNVAVTRRGGTQLTVTSAATTNGSVTLGTDGAALSLAGVSAGGANHDVTVTTTGTGSITAGSVAATRLVSLTAGGAIADDGNNATAVTAPALALTAATGVGTSVAPLYTDVDKLEAITGTGGVFVSNDGALTIGGVNGTLTGVRVTGASGAIGVVATGTITVNEGVQAPGDVALSATVNGSGIVTQGGSGNAVVSSGGTATLRADGNLTLGTATASGDVRGQGLVLEAGGDIVIDRATHAESAGAAGVTATAGGDVKILSALGSDSVLNSTAGGAPVSVTVGAGQTFVPDQGSNGGVGANGGNIVITADNMVLTSGTIGTTATVTLAPGTFAREVNLGTGVAGTLSLTDAELDRVAAGTLVIGSEATVQLITVSADLTRPTATNVVLVSGDLVQSSGGGSVDTAGGTLRVTPGNLSTYKPNRTGTDVTASELSFASGRTLGFTLGGTDPDTGYTRLTVTGTVNLAGAELGLLFPGSIVPSTGDVFAIVSATSRTGMFTGYGENSTLVFRGVTLRVNYTATTVTLTAIGAPTANGQPVTVGQNGANFPITLTGTDPNTPALPLTYTITDPPDHGTLSGSGASLTYTPTPGYSGPDSFQFTVSNGVLTSTAATVSITVATAPAVANVTPGAWTVNQSGFTGSLAITGGTPTFTVTAQTGLPPGLTAVVNGAGTVIVFTGTPTASGTFTGGIAVTDGNGAVVTKTVVITVNQALALTNLTTTAWTVGRARFTGTMTLSGGTPAHVITGRTGLPPGLTAALTGNTISFTGKPTAAGTFNGNVTVADSTGAQVTKAFTVVINAVPRFSLAANALPKYAVGVAYTQVITAAGGTGALRVALVGLSAPLPTGLRLTVSGSRVVLSGTPRALTPPVRITLRVTDALGVQTTVVYTLTGQLRPVRRGL